MNGVPPLDWLGERSRPYYGQVSLWVLVVSAFCLSSYFLTEYRGMPADGVHTGPVSVLSWLPESVLLNPTLFYACGALFVAGAVLWLAQVLVPWSGWLTAAAFSGMLALYFETVPQVTHVAHATNMVLWIYALWYHFYAAEIRTALAEGRFWTTPLCPRWLHALTVFYLGLFYGMSGLMKFSTAGFGWGNGVTMQLWVSLWGLPGYWTDVILADRSAARMMQFSTLLIEMSGLVAIVSWRLRPLIGLGIIGFHYGAIAVFGWAFHFNAILIGVSFLPFWWWLPRWFEALGRRVTPRPVDYPDTWAGRLRRQVWARLDVLNLWPAAG